MSEIAVYGFDFDYTLASYTPNLQPLIYDLAKHYMVDELKCVRVPPCFSFSDTHNETNLTDNNALFC